MIRRVTGFTAEHKSNGDNTLNTGVVGVNEDTGEHFVMVTLPMEIPDSADSDTVFSNTKNLPLVELYGGLIDPAIAPYKVGKVGTAEEFELNMNTDAPEMKWLLIEGIEDRETAASVVMDALTAYEAMYDKGLIQ